MATPGLSMNAIVHAALRRDLDRFEKAFAGFAPSSASRAAQLATAWAHLRSQLDEHHHGEETLFWPALLELGADRSLLDALGTEHAAMLAALGYADSAVRALAERPDADNAAAARNAVSALRDTAERHFAREERALEPLVLANLHSPPLRQAIRAQRRTQGPAATGTFLAWLEDGADPAVRTALAATIPRPVRAVLVGLFGRSYRATVAPAWSGVGASAAAQRSSTS